MKILAEGDALIAFEEDIRKRTYMAGLAVGTYFFYETIAQV